ncbi:hypothetical protein NI17_008165 [Thermobifida halotolerans]|uniref:Uncharacterized protein n=1 Tax=Thermobifida halotolerans TaxID=483545 RepID=A0AA97M5M1_9ACTN|nr:hypothetical protein [Thermobifida halotolerans]UOE21107.1 hypothetical protein NI17_008165 [Thermobifida halotolerans]
MTAERESTGRPRRTRPVSAFNVVLLAVAVLLVYIAGANLDRSVRAARADGTPGTFTAARLDCVQHPGHESCTCYGSYRSHDGAAERDQVYLYGGDRESCRIGEGTAAVDIGAANRVYGPEGSREWIFTVVLLVAGAALGVRSGLPVVAVLRRAGRHGT